MGRRLAWFACAAWAWAAAVALLDRRHALSLDDLAPREDGPLVSAIVPARNEQRGVRAAVASLAAQSYVPFEVVVVDDESTDATASEARAAASDRVLVVDGAPVPDGWVGKSWACYQGVQRAGGEWLLFTDADVRHAPDAVGRAIALALREGRGGLTLLPVIETGSVAERVVQPAAAVLIRSFVAPGPLVRSPQTPVAIAAGGFILVERELYERVGGHEAIRAELVDDAKLAARVKAAGGALVLASSGGRVRIRMYEGAAEVWRGWRKNTSVGIANGSLPLAIVGAASGAAIALAPMAACVRGPRLVGALGLALQLFVRDDVDPLVPTQAAYRLTLPAGTLFLSVVSLVSSLDRIRGGIEWRGRRYPVPTSPRRLTDAIGV